LILQQHKVIEELTVEKQPSDTSWKVEQAFWGDGTA